MTQDKKKGLIAEAKAEPSPLTTTKEEEDLFVIIHEDGAIDLEGEPVDMEELHRKLAHYCAGKCAEEAANVAPEFWEFPYTEHNETMGSAAYRAYVTSDMLDPDTFEQAQRVSGGMFSKFMAAADKVEGHFNTAMKALGAGVVNLDGEPWPTLEDGRPDLTPITEALCRDPFNVYRELEGGKVCPASDLISLQMHEEGDFEDEKISRAFWETYGHSITAPSEVNFRNHGERYAALCALCNLIGAEALRKAINYGEGEEENRREKITTLAKVKLNGMSTNHAFICRVLDGLQDIAHGAACYELTPRSGDSRERYVLTASEQEAAEFFITAQGNSYHARAILDTVSDLKRNCNDGFRDGKGRIWFSETVIAREFLRTKQGTIKDAKSADATKRIIHYGLKALSGARVTGEDAAGNTLVINYFLNAVFLAEAEQGGQIVKNVWGFEDHSTPIHDRERELGRVRDYPLLDIPPMNNLSAGVKPYVLDILNQARGIMYTKDGGIAQRKKILKYSWPKIFEALYPMTESIDSRKKNRVVSTFQKVLEAAAVAESKGEMYEGRPLYITARSERDAGRGSGKGAWKTLVIEFSTKFHKPKIDLK